MIPKVSVELAATRKKLGVLKCTLSESSLASIALWAVAASESLALALQEVMYGSDVKDVDLWRSCSH